MSDNERMYLFGGKYLGNGLTRWIYCRYEKEFDAVTDVFELQVNFYLLPHTSIFSISTGFSYA